MSPPSSAAPPPRVPGPGAAAVSGALPDAASEPWLAEVARAVLAALETPPLALLLGGSHAVGEGVWVTLGPERVTLSDLDLWAVVADEPDRSRARRNLARHAAPLGAALAALGCRAPLELTVVTPSTLTALPAMPGTLELRARGRALAGDPAWLARVPAYDAATIPEDERLRLLENRAFELLWARETHAAGATPLVRLRARHAVLKTALDLAAVLTLDAGELPMGARARVERARERLAADPTLAPLTSGGLESLWDAALAWRTSGPQALSDAEMRAEWNRATRAWVATWRHVTRANGADPVTHAVALARRASWPRRLRRSFAFRPRTLRPGLARRMRDARRGTPADRLGASATLLLIAAASPGDAAPVLGAPIARALARLDVAPATRDWDEAARRLLAHWDAWVLDGRRGTVTP